MELQGMKLVINWTIKIAVVFAALVIFFESYYIMGIGQAAQSDEAVILEAERKKAIASKAGEARSKGSEYEFQNNFDAAIAEYNIAIELKPDWAQLYVDRATVYDKKAEYRKAISDYSKAINLEPDWAAIYYSRAVDYYRVGNYGFAWSDVHKAESMGVQIDPYFLAQLEKKQERVNK